MVLVTQLAWMTACFPEPGCSSKDRVKTLITGELWKFPLTGQGSKGQEGQGTMILSVSCAIAMEQGPSPDSYTTTPPPGIL